MLMLLGVFNSRVGNYNKKSSTNSLETDYKAAPENVLQELYDLINIKKISHLTLIPAFIKNLF